MEEKTKPQPRGIRNNNPLNIRKGSSWKGERPVQTDQAFEEFVSMEWGIRAGIKLIKNHITGFNGKRPQANTIKKLISVWAPAKENNTEAYIRTVCQQTTIGRNDLLHANDRRSIIAIARAMAFVECGVWLEPELFESAYDLL